MKAPMKPDRDAALYAEFTSLLDAAPADLDLDDLMAVAETAEAGGDFAFLAQTPAASAIPASLITRATALGPRAPAPRARTLIPQWILALGTVLAFGSGSYALASTLSPIDTSGDWSVEEGLYDTAIDGGLFTFE